MKHFFSLFLLLCLALPGCIKDNDACSPGDLEIKLGSNVIHMQTRTPDETLPDGATVIVTKTSGDYENLYKNGTMSFESGGGQPVGFDGNPVYYPLGTPAVYMCAFNPAFTWVFSGSLAKHTYNGSQDVLCAAEVSVTATQLYQDNYPTMAFKHVLTQLTVSVQATASAATVWGEIISIQLTKTLNDSVKAGLQIDGLTGLCAPDAASLNAVLDFYTITDGTTYTNTPIGWNGQHIPLPATYTPVAYVMCTPVTATATDNEYTLMVKTTNVPDGVSIPINLKQLANPAADYTGTTQGYSFDIKLNFVNEELRAGGTLQPWENQGGAEIDV